MITSSAGSSAYPPGHVIPASEVGIIRRIGEGAFSDVDLAMCKSFGKVAIKWLKVNMQLFYPVVHCLSWSLEDQLCASPCGLGVVVGCKRFLCVAG